MRTWMSPVGVAAAAFVVALTAVTPAGAGPAAGAAVGSRTEPAQATAGLGRSLMPGAHVEARPRALTAQRRQTRAQLDRLLGGRLDLPALATGEGADEPVEVHAAAVRRAIPAGDLDGDGTADALLADPAGTLLTAYGGRDGAQLWQLPLAGLPAYLHPQRDLTGDGAADLLVRQYSADAPAESWGCTGTEPVTRNCRIESSSSYRWTVGVVDGRTGAWVWDLRIPGQAQEEYTSEWTGVGGVTVMSSQALVGSVSGVVGAAPLPATVDAPTVLVAVRGYRYELVEDRDPVSYEGRLEEEGTITVRVLDAATGEPRAERTQPWAHASVTVEAVGDQSGDGRADVLWSAATLPVYEWSCTVGTGPCTPVSEPVERALESLDAVDLATRWRADLEAADVRVTATPDLDGDGAGDLLLETTDGSSATAHRTRRLVSGRTGAAAWVHEVDRWRTPLAYVPLARGMGWLEVDTLNGRPAIVRIRRVDGATGEVLSASNHSTDASPEWLPRLTVSLAGDVDGDGAADVAVMAAEVRSGPSGHRRLWSLLESGATGAPLRAWEGSDAPEIAALGDVHGDGRDEILALRTERSPDGDRLTGTLAVVAAAVDAPLWSRPVDAFDVALVSGGDQDGQKGVELLLTEVMLPAPGEVRSEVRSLAGVTGAVRWTAR